MASTILERERSARPALRSPLRRAFERGWRLTGTTALVLLAIVGVATIAAAAAPLVGVRAVLLQTGSMAPGYPAGSVLLVRDAPATDAQVGDIVTVLRNDGTSVTHRVVETEAISGGAELVLRGDANETNDPRPYTAARVGIALGGLPWVGWFVVLAQQPGAVTVITAAMSLLVLWTWWPRARPPAHRAVLRRSGEGVV